MAAELAPEGIRVCRDRAGGWRKTPLLPTFMGGDSPELRARSSRRPCRSAGSPTIDDRGQRGAVPRLRRGPPSSPANVLEVDGGALRLGRSGRRSAFGLVSRPRDRIILPAVPHRPLPCRARLLGCASCGDVKRKRRRLPRGRASKPPQRFAGRVCARRAWIKPSAAPSSSISTTPRSPGSSF